MSGRTRNANNTAVLDAPATPDALVSDQTDNAAPLTDEERLNAAVSAYRTASDLKAKAAIRKQWSAALDQALTDGDLAAALFARSVRDALKSAPANSDKADTDPSQVLAERIVMLRAAATLLESGAVLPEGFDSEAVPTSLAMAAVNWSAIRDGANRLAGAKITRSADRNSISEVYRRAFEGQPLGTVMTIADIRRHGSIEGYQPSDGAIAARVKDGVCTVPGFEAVPATATAPLSIRYVGTGGTDDNE